jgi:mannose-6-phosphate isomerase-like protein (cupin superfamily)
MTMPKEPISIASAEHYTWGGPNASDCYGWHLVRGAGLSVIEERMPPGTSEKRHLHRVARQFFYVLAGELTLEVQGREVTLGAGQGLEIVPGAAHQAINRGAEDVRMLVISQPPSHGDRLDP